MLLSQSAISALAAPDEQTVRTPMSQEDCKWWVDLIRSEGPTHPTFGTEQNREKIKKLSYSDCYIEYKVEVSPPVAAFGIETAAAATSCRTIYETYGLYVFGWEGATARHNVRMCWNGTTAWHPSGTYEYCYVTTMPLVGSGSDYCKVHNNNTASANPHMEFYIFAWSTPWWHRYGYFGFYVNEDTGGTHGKYGFCCN
jgi:hypothetical protein